MIAATSLALPSQRRRARPMSDLTKEEFCRRFVEYMTREAGFEVFNNGQTVRAYAEEIAPEYWQNCPDNTPEAAAEADFDCWEGEE